MGEEKRQDGVPLEQRRRGEPGRDLIRSNEPVVPTDSEESKEDLTEEFFSFDEDDRKLLEHSMRAQDVQMYRNLGVPEGSIANLVPGHIPDIERLKNQPFNT